MKTLFLCVSSLIMVSAGCKSNDNSVAGNNESNTPAYFFTANFREVGGPQNLRLNSTLNASNAGIFSSPQSPPYQQVIIASYPFFNANNSDSIQLYMSVSWPLQVKVYADTPYVSDSVTLSLLSSTHQIYGVFSPAGMLSITQYSDSGVKGQFNFSSIARGSLVDTLYINGSFFLPHN